MGQLTNLYVSQSYQGLIKLANSTTGVTNTLQSTQDGLGNNLPIQISTSSVNITGSFTVNGQPVQADTGSLVTTASFNAYTSSNDSKVNSLISATGSYATTSSLTSLSSSIATTDLSQNNRLTSIESITGSLATTSSLTSLSQSIAVTDLGQNNRLTSIEGITGSINRDGLITTGSIGGSQSITGSLTMTGSLKVIGDSVMTGSLTVTTPSFAVSKLTALGDRLTIEEITGSRYGELRGTYLAFGSGSHFSQLLLNNDIFEIQTNGNFSVHLLNSSSLFNVTGSLNAPSITGSLQGTASYALQALSASYAPQDPLPAGLVSGSAQISYTGITDVPSGIISGSGQLTGFGFATTGSNVFQGLQTISGSLIVTGSITALSASITYLQTVFQTSSVLFSSGSNILGDEASDTQTLNGVVNIPLGNLNVTGATTSSLGFFGNLQGTASFATNALSASQAQNAISSSHSVNSNTAISSSFATNANTSVSSSFAQNAISSSNAINADNSISSSQAQNAISASHSVNSNTSISSSFAQNAISSSQAENAVSASQAQNAVSASQSTNTISSSFAQTAISSSQAQNAVSASQATNSNTASYVLQAVSASYANNATSASFSQNTISGSFSDFAVSSSFSAFAISSSQSQNAVTASFLTGTIASASYAVNADTASIAQTSISSSQAENAVSASYAINALSASVIYVQNTSANQPHKITFVDASNTTGQLQVDNDLTYNPNTNILNVTASFAQNAISASEAQNAVSASYAPSAVPVGVITTGSIATTQVITGSLILGNTVISGSIIGSSVNNGLIKIQSGLNSSSSLSIPFGYISSSNPSDQANLIFATNTSQTGSGVLSNNLTGSIVISGSNNIILGSNRTNTLVTAGTYGYIGGNNNIGTAIPTLGTGSILRPTINNNALQSGLNLQFTTSSLAAPAFASNLIYGATAINHQSGSAAFTFNYVGGNGFTSNANTTTLGLNPSTFGNIIAGITFPHITLNHNSSSITYQGNIGGGLTVTNNYSSSVSTAVNNITVTGNILGGQSNTLVVSGSNTSNRRIFDSNVVIGRSNEINSTQSGSSGGHLLATALLGQNLFVSASHTSTTAGGTVIVGRYNDTGSLALSQDIVFAVGTGTGTSNRRTGLYVTSGSLVGVSGSLDVIGNSVMTGSLSVTAGITGSLEGTASYAINALTASFALNGGGGGSINTGSFATTGSNIFRGNQTLTGSFNQTGSMNVIGDPSNPSSTIARFGDPNYGVVDITGNGQLTATNQIGVTNIVNWNTGGATNITISNERNAIYLLPKTATGSVIIGKNQSSRIEITGSLLSPSITGSLEGTASFATTASFALNGGGGSTFPFTGSAIISGSLQVIGNTTITGSVQGNVNALSISSDTASLDLNNGNFFTLQLVSGSATHINPSNIKPGQTVNILLSTTGSGTVNFPSSVKQISGSAYVPTTTTSNDIITLISFDSSSLFLANVKNLI